MAKDSFIIYTKYGEQIDLLSDGQVGVLMRALIKYQSGESLPKMDSMTNLVFSMIRQQIDFDNQKYDEMCKAKSEAGKRGAEYGKLGGRPTKRVETAKTADGVSKTAKTPKGLSKTAKTAEYESDNDNESDIPPLFISPPKRENTNAFADSFFEKYPRYAKDRAKMRGDIDYERLIAEFEKSSYLRNLYTVKQINDIYPCILTGDYRDKEKGDSVERGREYLAERERYYTAIRNVEERKVEAIVKKLMTYPRYAEIDKRLRTIQVDEGKASAKGDKLKLAKLEQERNRLRMERNNILANNGLEEEDITVKRHCRECNDTGWLEDGTICSCYKGG